MLRLATISGLRIADGFSPITATIPVGGIFIDHSTLNLNDCTVENNRSPLGGGIGSTYSTVALTNCTVANNFASGQGGGIQNGGYDSGDANAAMTLTNCTVSGNESGSGGGIFNVGTLTITNSTITANLAAEYGGGIDNGRKLTMINCTVTGNRADNRNLGASGGGISSFDSTTLSNTIVAGNFLGTGATPNDLKPASYTASHCLIGDAATSGGITDGTNGNIVGVNGSGTRPIETIINPVLEDNGGPTMTHALICGSPAIDAGDNALAAGLATDQRGLSRLHDGNGDATATVDIGAFEIQNACPAISAQAVSLAKHSSLTGVQIATVTDAEDAEQSLAVKINGSTSATSNGVSVLLTQPDASGKVTANIGATCAASTASFTLQVTDSAQQSTTATLTITVTPSNSPSFSSCPGNITRNNDAGQCSASVTFAPTASDDCDGAITPVCSPASGTAFPKGTTTVTCTATDADNQTATCSFTVTVNDTQPPAITPPANISVPATARLCSAVVTYNAPLVSDNCPGVGAPTCTPPSGTSFAKGTTTVTCTVKDVANNQASASFTVTVVDTQPPTIACPPNAVAATINPGDTSVAVSFETPSTIDNCGGVSVVCNPPSGAQFPRGTTTVNCTATDGSGN